MDLCHIMIELTFLKKSDVNKISGSKDCDLCQCHLWYTLDKGF